MKIEVISQSIRTEDLYKKLVANTNEIQFEVVELPKGTRPIGTTIIVALISSAGLGSIIVALINSVKEYKIEKMKIAATANEKDKDRQAKIEELKFTRETEMMKIQKERETQAFEGVIKIIGNYETSLLKEGKEKERQILEKKGVSFSDNVIKIPMEMSADVIELVDDVLEIKAVQEIIHVNR